jgi:hypothetical protein
MSALTDATYPWDAPRASTPAAEPFLNFDEWGESVWKADDHLSDPPESKYHAYGDYAAIQLAKQGRYKEDTDQAIRERLFMRAVKDGALPAEVDEEGNITNSDQLAERFNRPLMSAFTDPMMDAEAIKLAAMNDDSEDARTIRDAASRLAVLRSPAGRDMALDDEQYDQMLTEAEETLAATATPERLAALKDDGLDRALRDGRIPFAAFPTPDGGMRIEISPSIIDMADDPAAVARMFEADPRLDRRMLGPVLEQLKTPEGFEVPAARINRQKDFGQAVAVFADENDDRLLNDKLSGLFKGYTDNPEKAEAKFTDEWLARHTIPYLPQVIRERFNEEEQITFLRDMAKTVATPGHDRDDPIKGVTKLSTGEYHVPTALMLDAQSFDKITADGSPIPAAQRDRLKQIRPLVLEQEAPALMAVFAAQPYRPGKETFVAFRERMQAEGKTAREIVDMWTDNPDNHSVAMD